MKSARRQEVPARKLGILYFVSFCLIALLSGVSQALIVRELSAQNDAISAVGQFARRRSLDHSLSLAAMAILSAPNSKPEEHDALLEPLRKAIQLSEAESSGVSGPDSAEFKSDKADSKVSRLRQEAETHRRSAIQSAHSLLSLFERNGAPSPRTEESRPLVENIIAEEDAFSRASGLAAHASASSVGIRIQQIESLEFQLFGLLIVVLVLEGLFVVNPAVLKIQEFMRTMEQSHEELKLYAKKLERSNKELQDFASVASHDLQEPLRKIQAFSDRLKSRCAAAIDDQGRQYLDRIQNAAGRMQTLINDLLTYARVATKAQPFVPTDLVSITREVVSDLEARIEQVNGRVELGDLPQVDADPLQLRQLMQNLIGNSLKYRRPDVPPVVSIYSNHLSGNASKAPDACTGPYCQIVVEDNGIGFDEVYSEKIFTIFQRLHGRTEYEGTGVGLAVCRKIVERHGGTITARSTPGTGSTFTVTLPMRQPKEMNSDECES